MIPTLSESRSKLHNAYTIISEISSTRLRAKNLAISTCVNEAVYVACGVGIPYEINPDQGDLRGKLAFVFFGFSVVSIIYCFFCLPETKGRTFAELDLLFLRETKMRDFKTYVFDSESIENVLVKDM